MPDERTPPDGAFLRITEVAAEVGLTSRAIRYYEELGLLKPAARSAGSYRLYDADDIERLRFIRGLRDDAGFSLAEIGQLLVDEEARERNRARFRESADSTERAAILEDALVRVRRQIAWLEAKAERLGGMIRVAEDRRAHLEGHLADVRAGRAPRHDNGSSSRRPSDDAPAGDSGRRARRPTGGAPHR